MTVCVEKGVTGHVFVWNFTDIEVFFVGNIKSTKRITCYSENLDLDAYNEKLQGMIVSVIGVSNIFKIGYRVFRENVDDEEWFFIVPESYCRTC